MTDQQNFTGQQQQPQHLQQSMQQPHPPTQMPQPPASAQRPKRRRGVAIGVGIAGGVVALGMLSAAGIWLASLAYEATAASESRAATSQGFANDGKFHPQQHGERSWTVDLDLTNVRAIEVNAAASAMTVQFTDIEVPTLSIEGNFGYQWSAYNDEGTLQIERTGNANPMQMNDNEQATLLLPVEYDGKLSAEINVGAGDLSLAGNFVMLDINVEAGRVDYTGTATAVELEVGVGDATLNVTEARTIDASVGMGQATITAEGKQPASVTVDVELGSADVTLPAGGYRVSTQSEMGSITNLLTHDPKSPNVVDVSAEMGEITLR
ncbi:DUF4097 family beta strand repeat protein [Leucobacter sp. cx-328]|nr:MULTISPECIES: DUF4097 family beta strand repeat-containing protein [unclassified Leucobacter]MBC9943462.1 DUF4097 family beta strand repeat protein [Leucobacter sp. cx-328]